LLCHVGIDPALAAAIERLGADLFDRCLGRGLAKLRARGGLQAWRHSAYGEAQRGFRGPRPAAPRRDARAAAPVKIVETLSGGLSGGGLLGGLQAALEIALLEAASPFGFAQGAKPGAGRGRVLGQPA